jgi:hypothetical protein
MDKGKLKYVEDAEHALFLMRVWLRDMEKKLVEATDMDQRKHLLHELEEGRVQFAQMMAHIVIYKAQYQIYTLPKELK